MKQLTLVVMIALISGFALADNHEERGPFYAFYHFAAPDPAAVVAAMDKFWASDCGKQYPADAGLSQEVFNGGYPSTHFIINTFQNAADQQKAAEILSTCPSAIAFLGDMTAAGVEPVSQYLGMAPIDENDWGQDSVFTKYDIIVEPQNQAAFAAAFAKMTKALSKNNRYPILWARWHRLWTRQVYPLGMVRRAIYGRNGSHQCANIGASSGSRIL